MFFCETLILGMCLTGASLDHLSVTEGNNMEVAPITTNILHRENGELVDITTVEQDISHLYDSDQPSIAAGGSIYLDSDVRVSASFNNGYSSEKYNVGNTYSLGVDKVWELGENTYLTTGYTYTQTGNIHEDTCTTSEVNSAFNCRAGNVAITETATQDVDDIHAYRLALTWRF